MGGFIVGTCGILLLWRNFNAEVLDSLEKPVWIFGVVVQKLMIFEAIDFASNRYGVSQGYPGIRHSGLSVAVIVWQRW